MASKSLEDQLRKTNYFPSNTFWWCGGVQVLEGGQFQEGCGEFLYPGFSVEDEVMNGSQMADCVLC